MPKPRPPVQPVIEDLNHFVGALQVGDSFDVDAISLMIFAAWFGLSERR